MSENSNQYNVKNDPILKESQFCFMCEPKVLELVAYVRDLENAQIVAKQAIETLDLVYKKLQKERDIYKERIEKMDEKLKNKLFTDVENEMDKIDQQVQKMQNRAKLGI